MSSSKAQSILKALRNVFARTTEDGLRGSTVSSTVKPDMKETSVAEAGLRQVSVMDAALTQGSSKPASIEASATSMKNDISTNLEDGLKAASVVMTKAKEGQNDHLEVDSVTTPQPDHVKCMANEASLHLGTVITSTQEDHSVCATTSSEAEKAAQLASPMIAQSVGLAKKLPATEAASVRKSIQVLKPHIPLIKFRKGGNLLDSVSAAVAAEKAGSLASLDTEPDLGALDHSQTAASSSSSKWSGVQTQGPLEWWATPLQFKRRAIDDLECNIINSGGSDQIYQ